MTAPRTLPRWRQTSVGGHDIRIACRIELPHADTERWVSDVRSRLERAGFRADPATAAAPAVVVLRRGGPIGDLVLDGTGLGGLFRRIGPLAHRAVVLVERSSLPDGEAVVSLLHGAPVADEVADTVDAAIDDLVASGVRVGGAGWMRAVDLPAEFAGNPRTAAARGIR